jgi:hypothetical protein
MNNAVPKAGRRMCVPLVSVFADWLPRYGEQGSGSSETRAPGEFACAKLPKKRRKRLDRRWLRAVCDVSDDLFAAAPLIEIPLAGVSEYFTVHCVIEGHSQKFPKKI